MATQKNKALAVQKVIMPEGYPENPTNFNWLEWYTEMFRKGKDQPRSYFSERLSRLKQRSFETRAVRSRKQKFLGGSEQYMEHISNQIKRRHEFFESDIN